MKLRRSILIPTLLVHVLLVAGLAGCDKSPTRPTPLRTPTVAPAPSSPSPTPSSKTLKGSVLVEGMEALPGARVEITGGTGTGLSTTTNEDGRFELPNVAGVVTAQFTHDGYSPAQASIDVNKVVFYSVSLSPVGPIPSVAGDYTWTIAAASDCGLPDELKRRRYTAKVSQDKSHLNVTLGGATFQIGCPDCYHTFEGYAAQDRVTFILHGQQLDPLYGWPDIAEVVGQDQLLMFSGKASALPGPKMSGTFSGSFQLVSATSGLVVSTCSSEHHQFTLSR